LGGYKPLNETLNEPINGSDINPIALIDSVNHLSLEKTRELLENGACPNTRGWAGKTAMHHAAKKGEVGVVKALIEFGADCTSRDFEGNTPLHLANTARDTKEVVEALLSAGADANAKGPYGKTPIHTFTYSKSWNEALEVIAKKGSSLDVQDDEGQTPLHIAIAQSKKIVEKLIRLGASTSIYDKRGHAPIHSAALRGALGSLEVLCELSDVNLLSPHGETALHYAAKSTTLNCERCLKVLLEAKCDWKVKDEEGKTAMDILKSSFFEADAKKGARIKILKEHIIKEKLILRMGDTIEI
jgi:ankyrin repeat protein